MLASAGGGGGKWSYKRPPKAIEELFAQESPAPVYSTEELYKKLNLPAEIPLDILGQVLDTANRYPVDPIMMALIRRQVIELQEEEETLFNLLIQAL
jgi:hypothetical protein